MTRIEYVRMKLFLLQISQGSDTKDYVSTRKRKRREGGGRKEDESAMADFLRAENPEGIWGLG